MTLTLEVHKRDGTESAKTVRHSGNVPGVVYGPKQESISIAVDKKVIEKVLKEAGESTIITLTGLGESIDTLVHDVAFNAARGGVEHIDFYAIEKGKDVTTDVPLEFIGESPAVKHGGVLTKVLHAVEVTCKPTLLPSHIDVDVSVLEEFGAQIKVSDLKVASGVTISNDPNEIVAVVAEAEEEPEVTEAVDMSSIEVEKKGKEEESAPAAE